jgi:hypothetical protein
VPKQTGYVYSVKTTPFFISDLFNVFICHSDYAAFGSRMTANNALDSA